jgi:putative spermidine/putrescine transport system ATP-binding protein
MKGNLIIDKVCKSYGALSVLRDVTLQISMGELTSFLGPSGCGKTTLLRLIAGFDRPTSGRIWLDGRDITELKPQERGLGMVFQSLALFPHMTVEENIAYGLKRQRVAPGIIRDRVPELLSVTRLTGLGARPVTVLSGGQRQRVAIARALAVNPSLLLLDEPMSALDARLRDQMQVELRELQQRLHVTTLFVTHDQTEAMMLSDKLAVFSAGELQQFGRPSDVYRNPANPFVADFLGAANLVDGAVESSVSIAALGTSIRMQSGGAVGTKMRLALRAEDIRLQPSEGDTAFRGEVQLDRDLGAHSELIIRCGTEMLRVQTQRHGRSLVAGSPIDLFIRPEAISLFPEQEGAR